MYCRSTHHCTFNGAWRLIYRAALGLFIAAIPLRIRLYLAFIIIYNSYGHVEISIVGAAIASLLTSSSKPIHLSLAIALLGTD